MLYLPCSFLFEFGGDSISAFIARQHRFRLHCFFFPGPLYSGLSHRTCIFHNKNNNCSRKAAVQKTAATKRQCFPGVSTDFWVRPFYAWDSSPHLLVSDRYGHPSVDLRTSLSVDVNRSKMVTTLPPIYVGRGLQIYEGVPISIYHRYQERGHNIYVKILWWGPQISIALETQGPKNCGYPYSHDEDPGSQKLWVPVFTWHQY